MNIFSRGFLSRGRRLNPGSQRDNRLALYAYYWNAH